MWGGWWIQFLCDMNCNLTASCQTHYKEVGEGRCWSEDLQQVSCTAESVSNITRLTLTLHLWKKHTVISNWTSFTLDYHLSSSSLTLHPVAEGVPGLTQVFTGAIVHDAHVSEATVGVGVGGGVCHTGLVQPAGSTHVQPALQIQTGPADSSFKQTNRTSRQQL